MRKGVLIFDKESNRYDIRFNETDYYGGLHCGDPLEVMIAGKWKQTCIEKSWDNNDWYLTGVKVKDINGLIVRI